MKNLENAVIRIYPDGSGALCATNGPLRRAANGRDTRALSPETAARFRELCDRGTTAEERGAKPPRDKAAENLDRARRRARSAVRDLALCNRFDWFVTLTLDQTKIDRYDVAEIIRRASQWLSNAVRRYGLRYVLIPERHKDGAIHFHGFMSGELGAVDSGHRDKGGHPVYNLTAWPFGFSTAIAPYAGKQGKAGEYGTEYRAAVHYCTKYISKQQEKIGGRWYYSGGALARPEKVYVDIDDMEWLADAGAYEFRPRGMGRPFWLLDVPAPVVSVLTDSKGAYLERVALKAKERRQFEDCLRALAGMPQCLAGEGPVARYRRQALGERWEQIKIGVEEE